MSRLLFTLLCLNVLTACAQPKKYTVSNAHAHNDYEHARPFYSAYEAGFGSIEADIFLRNGQLFVAHNSADISDERTLTSLYLDPLQKAIKNNNGHVYADSSKNLLLLIDLKTAALPTLDALLKLLLEYRSLTGCPSLKIAITGNQPDASKLLSYPSYIFFDGRLNQSYTEETMKKIALFSDNFKNYSSWNGKNVLEDDDRKKIQEAITKAHSLGKPIRFWATPDLPNAWKQFMELAVDYINTDKVEEVEAFLK